ncbi:MAG TPA: TIGR03960 family B12-binding radical SAM protein [Candidatus Fimenecus excrementigallinarum]|uniref:TIGR03960 family B12-binding radical SAM protein n=1 Tax=Candidatus Fimenecus excrementigallinarum TaxID=2840816 RepID=A0A9D1IG68_9FIRM|nr:TIGR03960 family B12-binding radical SAM protein [Candidatus Fimenecus excrementigallinarum]
MALRKEWEYLLDGVQKPARYTGGELNSVIKDKSDVGLRYAFCFPDNYEIGMSHLGMKILYGLVNARPDAWCERVFAPWPDMEARMRANGVPLFALESGDPVAEFDLIGFTLQYELSYTNVLNMLDLAGLPVRAAERTGLTPIVVGGGPCVCNPEPVADFFDLFLPGEGEEVTDELVDLLIAHKQKGSTKLEFLRDAAKIEGVYVPAFYDVSYNPDGTLFAVTPKETAPAKVKKRVIADLDSVYYPDNFVVPFIDVVHDRAVAEVFRGCIRGCRFCQAGFIYRPIREKRSDTIDRQARTLCESTGYDEVSLCSLSTSDYSEIESLVPKLLSWAPQENINVALPSLRVDNFSETLMEELKKVRKSGLTFAPEAGTQRLRDAINKNVTEEEVLKTCRQAFAGGWSAVKLYFMMGLPTETLEDVAGIAELAQKVVNAFYENPDKPKGKGVTVSVSVASFVPKPFTPFQWEPQDTMAQLEEKQKHLLESVHTKKIKVSYHQPHTSLLEGVLARGDRKLCAVLEEAWRRGCKFDSWDEFFRFDAWTAAFDACGIDPAFYANRRRDFSELLPWEHLDYGIRRAFLESENQKAHQSLPSPNCREKCAACGAARLNGGHCDAI